MHSISSLAFLAAASIGFASAQIDYFDIMMSSYPNNQGDLMVLNVGPCTDVVPPFGGRGSITIPMGAQCAWYTNEVCIEMPPDGLQNSWSGWHGAGYIRDMTEGFKSRPNTNTRDYTAGSIQCVKA